MLILASANDKLQVVLGAVGSVNVHCSYLDNVSGSVVPGRQNTVIVSSVADVVDAPPAGVYRNLKTLHAYNAGAAPNDVIVQHTDGTLTVELHKVTLPPGATLQYIDEIGFAIPEAEHIPVGTRMLFQQSMAPVGWTKDTLQNDKALRVVNGTVGAGGTLPFSTVFNRTSVDPHTLSVAEEPYHAHSVYDPTHTHYAQTNNYFDILGWYYPVDPGSSAYVCLWGSYDIGVTIWGNYTGISIYGQGGSQPHTHGLDLRLQYVDVIIATKN